MDKSSSRVGRDFCGEVQISGAKNAALPILCSALLTEGWNTYHNIPDLMDVRTAKKLIGSFWCRNFGRRIRPGECSKHDPC